ncbi:hypothetical protein, partial [Dickeya dianthicola]|uniref:hypothetical protein n=2 Tax=Dickeya dianthicola TaxID=204039 RepID=UPI001F614D95
GQRGALNRISRGASTSFCHNRCGWSIFSRLPLLAIGFRRAGTFPQWCGRPDGARHSADKYCHIRFLEFGEK